MAFMAWHNRYINSISTARLRLTIEFVRPDLLWVSPIPVTNPLTGETFTLPYRLSPTVAVSPNVLDLVLRSTDSVEPHFELTQPDGTKKAARVKVEKLVWRLRSPQELSTKLNISSSLIHL